MQLDLALVRECVRRALDEDLGAAGDVTTRLCVPEGARARARIVAKQAGVIAGLPVVEACLRRADAAVSIQRHCAEGARVEPGVMVLTAEGVAAGLLAAERTALNFLQRLSGIATAARALVDAVGGSGLRVYDTRKTTPGLRALERYAVAAGGACNHRFGLFDQVLIKENHFALAGATAYGDVVRAAVAGSPAPVVAEARDAAEGVAAVEGGAAVVLLDNFAPGPSLREAVAAVRSAAARSGRAVEIEASGGVTADNATAFASCGVDRVSVGALTHSVRALDLSMLLEAVP